MPDIPTSLADLVGTHTLDFVPRLDIHHPFDTSSNGVMFGLSGRVYFVYEDPSDGYRSAAGPLLSFTGAPYEIGGEWHPEYLRNVQVVATMEGDGGEVLTIRHADTQQVLLRVGTDNADDYYPSYVAEWTPIGARPA